MPNIRIFKYIRVSLKGRHLWPSVNCQDDICPGNTCPSNICLYQEYLSCHWPDFDQTLKVGSLDHLEQISTVSVIFGKLTFVLTTLVHIRNISAVTDQTLKIGFWTQCFAVLDFNQIFLTKICLTQTFFHLNRVLLDLYSCLRGGGAETFTKLGAWLKIAKVLGPKIFWLKHLGK